jgi:hypothetical protein
MKKTMVFNDNNKTVINLSSVDILYIDISEREAKEFKQKFFSFGWVPNGQIIRELQINE